jgi:nicotinamidase-related amidase
MSTVNSRPYRWPYHGTLRPATTAILVFSDGIQSAENSPAIENLRRFVERGRAAGMRVVYSPGRTSEPVLDLQPGDLVCERPAYGGFTGTDMTLVLGGIGATDLLMAGFPLELGADCTMREANDLGYECLLLTDCCTSLSSETEAGAISSVQMSGGIFGAVATSQEVLAALQEGVTA